MAVFLPVAFMSGIVGRFLQSFGVTMAFAIAVSLFVSFSLTPMLAARWLRGPVPKGEVRQKDFFERFVARFYRPIESVYTRVLKWVMGHRWVVVAACALTFGSCAPLAGAIPKGFQPENDLAEFEVNVRTPEGTSLTQTRLVAEGIARQIRTLREVEHTLLTIGNDAQQTQNRANIYVRLVDPDDRKASQSDLIWRTACDGKSSHDNPRILRIDRLDLTADQQRINRALRCTIHDRRP